MMELDELALQPSVMSLARGLEILRCFSAKEPRLTHSELVAHTGLPKSTVSRLTKTLVDLGYLRHDRHSKRYFVGASVLSLGYSALSNLRTTEIAKPHMQALANSSGALVSLATRDRLSMLYLETCASDTSMTLKMGRGVRMPMLTTSIGRAFLAAINDQEREYLVSNLKQRYASVIDGKQIISLQKEILRFKSKGYCLSLGDWNQDVNAAATPIFWKEANDVIILSISGPSFMITEKILIDELAPKLMSLSTHISRCLS